MLLAVLLLSGCTEQSSADLGGPEHFVPQHWPADLADAAEKIRRRADRLRSGTDASELDIAEAQQQLRDIVGWIPEVAADTDLSEQQWLPIYHASESLSKRLHRMPLPLDALTSREIASYCELLENQSQLLGGEPMDAADQPQNIETDPTLHIGDTQ